MIVLGGPAAAAASCSSTSSGAQKPAPPIEAPQRGTISSCPPANFLPAARLNAVGWRARASVAVERQRPPALTAGLQVTDRPSSPAQPATGAHPRAARRQPLAMMAGLCLTARARPRQAGPISPKIIKELHLNNAVNMLSIAISTTSTVYALIHHVSICWRGGPLAARHAALWATTMQLLGRLMIGRGAPNGVHVRRGCKPLTRSTAAVPDAESRATRTLTR